RAAALARLRCATVGLCVTQRPEGGEPMGWIRKHRPSPATGIALAALIVALGGVAFAAIPDSNGTIHGCFQKNSGGLRVVQSSGDCRDSEQALDWNQQGPKGPPGGGIAARIRSGSFAVTPT